MPDPFAHERAEPETAHLPTGRAIRAVPDEEAVHDARLRAVAGRRLAPLGALGERQVRFGFHDGGDDVPMAVDAVRAVTAAALV